MARSPLQPERLGSDETFRRPQRFATVLVDLSAGRLWDLLEGRSKAVVVDSLAELGLTPRIGDVIIDLLAGSKAVWSIMQSRGAVNAWPCTGRSHLLSTAPRFPGCGYRPAYLEFVAASTSTTRATMARL